MQAVQLTTVFDIAFAAGVVVAAVALAGAALRFLPRLALALLAVLAGGGAVAAWVVFALHRRHHGHHELTVAAAGLTVAAIATAVSLPLRRALARADAIDAHLAEAQARLAEQIDRETADRAEELERTLARARADSVSLLAEEERKLGEERRREFADREREVGDSVTEALTSTQA